MPVIVSIKADNKIYLHIGNENVVSDFETVERAMQFFERPYEKAHSRGYEASMSACINYITYQPRVHNWEYENLSPLVEQGVIDNDTYRAYELSHVSGHVKGALCTGVNAEIWHESGISPSLVRQ